MANSILAFDITTYKVSGKNALQLMQARTAKSTDDGVVNNSSIEIIAGETVQLPNFINVRAISLISTGIIDLYGKLDGTNEVLIEGVTTFVLDSKFEDIRIVNQSGRNIRVQIATISSTGIAPPPVNIYLRLYFDTVFTNPTGIIPLTFTVQDIDTLDIKNMALEAISVDQDIPQSANAPLNTVRICDPDGTANDNGTHIMLLDLDIVNSIFVPNTFYIDVLKQGA